MEKRKTQLRHLTNSTPQLLIPRAPIRHRTRPIPTPRLPDRSIRIRRLKPIRHTIQLIILYAVGVKARIRIWPRRIINVERLLQVDRHGGLGPGFGVDFGLVSSGVFGEVDDVLRRVGEVAGAFGLADGVFPVVGFVEHAAGADGAPGIHVLVDGWVLFRVFGLLAERSEASGVLANGVSYSFIKVSTLLRA